MLVTVLLCIYLIRGLAYSLWPSRHNESWWQKPGLCLVTGVLSLPHWLTRSSQSRVWPQITAPTPEGLQPDDPDPPPSQGHCARSLSRTPSCHRGHSQPLPPQREAGVVFSFCPLVWSGPACATTRSSHDYEVRQMAWPESKGRGTEAFGWL